MIIIKYRALIFTYLDSRLDKQTVPCLTLYWEFTAKLIISSDLTYQLYNYSCIKEQTTTQQNHNTRYNVVHPQFSGYFHRTVFYSTLYKNHSSDLRTQLQIPSIPQSCTLSCRSLRTQLQIFLITKNPLHTQLLRSSMHTAGN